jgi:hypothetical protein
MTLFNQSSTNYFFYLNALAALTTGAAIAAGIYMNTAASAATTQLATSVIVSTPSILPAIIIIGVLLLTAALLSESSSSCVSVSRPSYYGSFLNTMGPARVCQNSPFNTHTHGERMVPAHENTHGHSSHGRTDDPDSSSHGHWHS